MLNYKDHDKWAVAALVKDKQSFKAPPEWGELALHHQISKVYLQGIGVSVLEILADKKAKEDLKKAAQTFWDIVQSVVPAKIKEQANGDFITILWNMPLNLEIGPDLVSNNPGIGLDPNTEPKDGGSRKLTNVSALLQQLERTYLKALREGGLTATHLNNMAGNLKQAYAAFQKLRESSTLTYLAIPCIEQWVVDPLLKVGAEDKFLRKGLKIFIGVHEGKIQFARAGEIGQSAAQIANLFKQKTPIVTTPVNYVLQGAPQAAITINVVFPEGALYHICVRHTYAYFDFNQAKVVNSFWPNPHMSSGDVRQWVISVLPHIGRVGGDYLQGEVRLGTDLTEIDTFLVGQNIRIGDTDQLFYFIAKLEIDDIAMQGSQPVAASFKMTVETATLDADAHGYTRDELLKIK